MKACLACKFEHSPLQDCKIAARIRAVAEKNASLAVANVVANTALEGSGGEGVALYRHFDPFDALLYVGISANPSQRSSEHADGSKWFRSVSKIEIEWHSSRSEALNAERLAIRLERPLYNFQHNRPEVLTNNKTGEESASRHGKYADLTKRRTYMREYMRARRASEAH